MRKLKLKRDVATLLFLYSHLSWGQGFNCLKAQPFSEAVAFEKTDCSEAYEMSESLLDDFKEQRMTTIKANLGLALNNSVVKAVDSMAQVDFLNSYFKKDYGKESSCSLSKAYETFPCLKEGNQNLAELTNGRHSDVKDLFSSIAKRYSENVSGTVSNDPKKCLNPFLRKKMAMDRFLKDNKDLDLKKLMEQGTDGLNEEGLKDYNNILGPLFMNTGDIDLSHIEGDTLSEQVESVLSHSSENLEKHTIATCQKMIEKVVGVVCSPVNHHSVDDSGFNSVVFQYEQDSHMAGFDEFEAEFSDVPIDQTYGHFILNCQPACEIDCEKVTTLKEIKEKYFGENIEDHFVYNDLQEQYYHTTVDEEFCPLIACGNGLEVQKGAQCEPLEVKRTPQEMREYLNCEEDQYCQTRSFQGFASLLELPGQDSDHYYSSFSRQFLGETFTPVPVSTGKSEVASSTEAVTPLRPEEPAPEIARRIKKPKPQKIATASKPQSALSVQESPRNALQDAVVTEVPLKTSGAVSENQFDRDLYKRMGSIIRDSLEHQEKSTDYYEKNLEEIVAANKELEQRINSRMGEGPTTVAKQFSPPPQVRTPLRPEVRRAEVDNSAWQSALAENKKLNAQWNNLNQSRNVDGASPAPSEAFETNPGRPGGGGGRSLASQATSGGTLGSTAGAAASSATGEDNAGAKRLGALAGGGILQENLKSIETQINTLPQMDHNELTARGVSLEEPFLLKVKVEGRFVTVPVRPFLYKGKKMLAPVIDQENWILSSVLRKSPLFTSYYDYERKREAKFSAL